MSHPPPAAWCAMSKLESLKSASSLRQLAVLLGVWPSHLSYVLYVKPGPKYTAFEIPKRGGGSRTIEAPNEALKHVQRQLYELLRDCMKEIQDRTNIQDHIAHGFVPRKSIVTNARRHRHRRWVFNIDLEDFFPSINFGRVRGFLLKNRDFELHESVATVIAQIACHNNALPQGSPCSPIFSNLIAHVMDIRLVHLASRAGCIYTRYADDLTFSTNKAEFPAEIAEQAGTNEDGVQTWAPSEKPSDNDPPIGISDQRQEDSHDVPTFASGGNWAGRKQKDQCSTRLPAYCSSDGAPSDDTRGIPCPHGSFRKLRLRAFPEVRNMGRTRRHARFCP